MNPDFQRGLSVAERIAFEFDWADEPETPGYEFNGSEGWTWAEQHPVRSGEDEYATNVRACTWRNWARRNVQWAIAHKINCARTMDQAPEPPHD